MLLNSLKHLNVIKFYGIVYPDNHETGFKYLMFEYMNMGDLLGFLKNQQVNKNLLRVIFF